MTVQSPFQVGLNAEMPPRCVDAPVVFDDTPLVCPSAATCPSYWMPCGLVPKTKAFRESLKVSRATMIASTLLTSASRRDCAAMIRDGSRSKQITEM